MQAYLRRMALVKVESNILTLTDREHTFTIKESALCDTDREYLLTLCDPYFGIDEASLKQKLIAGPKQKPITDEQFFEEAAEMKRKEQAEMLECLPNSPYQGQTGTILGGTARLTQILGPDSAMIEYRFSYDIPDRRQVLLKGISTDGLADDMTIGLSGKYLVDGTYKYKTTMNAVRTVFIIKPVRPEAKKEEPDVREGK